MKAAVMFQRNKIIFLNTKKPLPKFLPTGANDDFLYDCYYFMYSKNKTPIFFIRLQTPL